MYYRSAHDLPFSNPACQNSVFLKPFVFRFLYKILGEGMRDLNCNF